MSDTTQAAAPPKVLSAKKIKRRVEQIAAGTDPRTAGKKRKRLAENILRQIASGQIRNPVAAARAFFEGESAGGAEAEASNA
jgi:hypothetical protein